MSPSTTAKFSVHVSRSWYHAFVSPSSHFRSLRPRVTKLRSKGTLVHIRWTLLKDLRHRTSDLESPSQHADLASPSSPDPRISRPPYAIYLISPLEPLQHSGTDERLSITPSPSCLSFLQSPCFIGYGCKLPGHRWPAKTIDDLELSHLSNHVNDWFASMTKHISFLHVRLCQVLARLAFSCMSISLALPVDRSGRNSDPGVSVMTPIYMRMQGTIISVRYQFYFWYGAVIHEEECASKAARGGAKLLTRGHTVHAPGPRHVIPQQGSATGQNSHQRGAPINPSKRCI